MTIDSIILELSLIIVGAGVLGTLFLFARQPIIIAYIAIGVIIGPAGFGLMQRTEHIEEISHFGVILLLFLIGLNLQPDKLVKLFRETWLITLSTSLVFGGVSLAFALLLGFDLQSGLLFGAAMMFSSTVVGLKLIPTTALHHRRTGEIMTSILLLQDILAILVILFVTGEQSDNVLLTFLFLIGKFAVLAALAFAGVRYVMIPLMQRFDVIQEYTFLATLAWCLMLAEGAKLLGLSYELGAFVAGLSIASCQVALYIAEHLKPLREFFLILFFFAVGARISLDIDLTLLLGAVLFGALVVPFKALVFRFMFGRAGEEPRLAGELASRLGQSSEFSLLVAFSAVSAGVLAAEQAMVIQIATIVSFVISTYWVVSRYPTTISGNPKLLQD